MSDMARNPFPVRDAASCGDAPFLQSAFSPSVYFPRIVNAPLAAPDSSNAAAAAPDNGNSNNAALLASLFARAQQAEAEAAEAEMQYFLSKRKAAMAAARAASQNYQLLKQDLAAQQDQKRKQQQQQQQQPPALSGARTSISSPLLPAETPDASVESDALASMRRAEVEAAGAFLDLARGVPPSPPQQQKAAAPVPRQQKSVVAPSTFGTFPVAADLPSGVGKAVTPESSPKLSSLQINTPSLPPLVPFTAFAQSSHIGFNSQNDAKGSSLHSAVAAEPKKQKGGGKAAKASAVGDDDAPKRAFTAYNIFFAVEREKILKVVPDDVVLGEDRDSRIDAVLSLLGSHFAAGEEEDMEKRAAVKILKEQCDTVGSKNRKAKRKHRKSHGKVGFVDMTYIISRRWKALPQAKVNWYKDLGKMDMLRFQKARDEYNNKIKN